MDFRALPKAELHLHIEGTLEPEMVFKLAVRNNVPLPWDSVETLHGLRNFTCLQSFLDLYYQAMMVLRTREDFFDLAMAYAERAHADGIRHVEIFFDPQVHLDNGVSFEDVLGGLSDALAIAEAQYDITGGLILCFLRDRGPVAAKEVFEIAKPFADKLIGVGLDSSEVGFPAEPFAEVFESAHALGLHLVAHAGEEGPPPYVWSVLQALHVERVDHGLRSLEDAALVQYLVEKRIPLTSCPFSNVRLNACSELRNHPLRTMLERNLVVTINSDDPAYFGGYLGDNLAGTIDALGLTDAHVKQLCRNSIEASFATKERKAELLAQLP